MKIAKLILILFFSLPVVPFTCFGQTKVAILDPITSEDSNVSSLEKAMLRGELRKAIFRIDGFEAISRSDLDQVLNELDFQHMGYVPKQEIHHLGQISGADFLCISTLSKSDAQFYLEAYLVDVSTGEIESPASQLGEVRDGKMMDLYAVCQQLVKELIGDKTVTGGAPMIETFEQNTWGWTLFSHDAKTVQIANDELRLTNYASTGTTQSDVMLPVDVRNNFRITFNFVIQDAKMLSSVGIKFSGYNNEFTVNSGTCTYRIGSAIKTSTVGKIGLGRNKPVVIELTKKDDRVSFTVNGIDVCDEECQITSNQISVYAGINTLAMLRQVSIQYIK